MGNNPSAAFIALGVLLVLALVTRWVFRPSRKQQATRPVDASESAELGLLTVIATALPRQDALGRRAVLGEANIRSSMSRRRDGTFDVLVFHADVQRARILLGP